MSPRKYSGEYPRLPRGRSGFDSPPGSFSILTKIASNCVQKNGGVVSVGEFKYKI